MNLKESIRQRARELGFDDCHFTTANPPEHAHEFREWLTEHRQGEMGYLERNGYKRMDPQQVLPGARCILTLAASYHTCVSQSPIEKSREPIVDRQEPRAGSQSAAAEEREQGSHDSHISHHGLVARYARFSDYHVVLGECLKELTGYVNELGGDGTRSLWYVDTGPLLERDLAQRAGLGFIGKHTNLIHRRHGNWFFLAEVITTLELAPDSPERNHCGSCARCLAACPTSAITAPFQLDARRCISYLTIELKGSIPPELRPAIGNRIYGCDDCLAVCPWNRFAREGSLMKQHARPDLAALDLVELLSLDESGFKRCFAGTPVLRVRRRGLMRNVCVALGNAGEASALPALRKAATDSEPLIAEHAEWAIEQIESRIRGISLLP
jgi:epoxyqueuosine reductase